MTGMGLAQLTLPTKRLTRPSEPMAEGRMLVMRGVRDRVDAATLINESTAGLHGPKRLAVTHFRWLVPLAAGRAVHSPWPQQSLHRSLPR